MNLFTRKRFKETKIKSYSNEAKHLHDEEIPKVGCNYTCLVVILINFVLKKDENYCLQKFLKEFKYTKKEKKYEILDILLMRMKFLLMILMVCWLLNRMAAD